MLHFDNTGGVLRVAQEITSPSIYLDHWALREISESDALARRFSSVLNLLGGTLVLSWLNAVEFSRVADPAQRRKADSLLDALSLNIFCLNPDFLTVVKQEYPTFAEGDSPPPWSDLEFDHAYVATGLNKSRTAKVLGPQTLFSDIVTFPEVPEQFDQVAEDIAAQLERLRGEFDNDNLMRLAIEQYPRDQSPTRGTRLIARDLVGRFLKDKSPKLSRNNAIDLLHAVVSASYCDYVLLDRQWAAMVNDSRRRMAKAGVSIPIAKVFSKRANGVEEFLKELEHSS